eukprot:Nitzschia sp. Nitz4//scaffold570_size2933//805//1731//NITZ4_009284-RA/size2933-augustus-gene-0.2-mRNA-1//1//CDS//3329554788//9460//frame0
MVPRNHREVVELDAKNGNTKWQDTEKLELQQLYEYSTFKDIGHKSRIGVVSTRKLRIIVFLAELNSLALWSTDVGNAYLEAYTQEKVSIIAGPEFGSLAGHILIIIKALYGSKSSSLRWHERLADVLCDMGFFPSRAEDPNIWMRMCNGNYYEYIAVYVDDLLIASQDPNSITDLLQNKFKFKLKGTGEVVFHLGCDYFRDKDGTLACIPRKYIEKLIAL